MAVASKHVRDHPPAPRELNPSIPPTFEAIILKAMAKDPAHRYATAEELRADLLRFNEGRIGAGHGRRHRACWPPAGATQVVGAVAEPDRTQAVPAATGHAGGGRSDEDRSNRTRTYAIILAILLILLLGAGFLLARNLGYLGGAASFNLPNVTGKPVAEATATLKNDGLDVTAETAGLQRRPGDGHLHRSRPQHPGQEGRHHHPEGGRARADRPRWPCPPG